YAERTEADIEIDSIASQSTLRMMNGFLQQRIDLNEQFHFRWGLRTNIDLSNGKSHWQPRAGLEFYPVNGLKLYTLSGVYYQFLSGIKRFDSQGYFNRIWYLPAEDGLGTVRGKHFIAGLKYENRGWFVDFEMYLKNTSGRVNLFAEEVSSGNRLSVAYFPYEMDEKNRGLDLFVQKKQRHFNHMISYSLSSFEVKTEGFLDNKWFPDYNDRPHRLKITEMVNWRNWTLTGSWQVASGLPVLRFQVSEGTEDFQRTGYFSQLDFALSKKVVLSRFVLNAGVSMLNVLNRENVVEVNYLRFSSELGSMTVRSDISALGFTPVFFMNVRFQ
ncbi:MAG: TonB-dependent receptor domain-containing protein, partial [Tangfeifania sp.]